MNSLHKKLRNYEIRIRKAVTSQMQGDFHSVFKGSGLEFDDVRAYQYGDDVRYIDWNVSAKGHGTFVKTYQEEKEQSIFFLLDVSGSQEIGSKNRKKLDIAREICGVLALSGVKESSQVGLIAFSDRKELFIKPKKGLKHAYFLINQLFSLQPQSRQTDLEKAFVFALNHIKRKSMVIVVSDFIDENYQHFLKALARKHDVIVMHMADARERSLPSLGIVPIKDKESGQIKWMNTSGKRFREKLGNIFLGSRSELEQFCHKLQINYLYVDTREDYVGNLIKLFKVRNKSAKRA